MRRFHTIILTLLAVTVAGCASCRDGADDSSLQAPLEIRLGEPGGTPCGPLALRSGQMLMPPRCCPPLELRNARGDVVQVLDVTAREQRLVAPVGLYSLVGHDPSGKECVLRLRVTNE